jgi:SM-20-related protein
MADKPDAVTGAQLDEIVRGIAEDGIVVLSDFLPESAIAGLRDEAGRLGGQGAFRRAGIGAGGDYRTRDEIRGDEIFWIEPDSASAPLRVALDALETMRLALNRELYLGLIDFECHLARYRAGAGYQRHYDQLRRDGRRQVTLTLYLNQDWREADGGKLRVFLDESEPSRELDILPAAGTLVAFLSARFAHQVLPCARERLSLTCWFRRR